MQRWRINVEPINLTAIVEVLLKGEYYLTLLLYISGMTLIVLTACVEKEKRQWLFWGGMISLSLGTFLTVHYFTNTKLDHVYDIVRGAAMRPELFR
jgi:glucuronate isomerase